MTTIPFPFTGRAQDLDMRPLPLIARQTVALLTPFRVLGSLLTGTPSMEELTQEVNTRQRSLGRKFNKVEAVYTLAPPVPPIAWRYECGRCRFYHAANRTCNVVGLRDDPWGGEAIHPLAWCAWWLPLETGPTGTQPLIAWVTEVVDPSRIPPGVTT